MAHAYLSASSSSRWLRCTAAPSFESNFEDKGSIYAEEGTKAHDVAEKLLRKYFAGNPLPKSAPSGISADMFEYVMRYVEICIEKANTALAVDPGAAILVEDRLDFSNYVPEGFGTGDCVIVADGVVEVIDLKYGKGVVVNAENNSQLRLYGLGAYDNYSFLYDISAVRMTIVQPRLDCVSSELLTVEELTAWGESIKPKAREAFDGNGAFCAGEHCMFCKGKIKCRALADYNLNVVKEELAPTELENFEISEILERKKQIENWLTAVGDYALGEVLAGREYYPGFKLVLGRSSRKISDEEKAAERLKEAGLTEDKIFKPKALSTITNLEKILGKKEFNNILGTLVVKPQGAPTLVPESDKREAYVPTDENDFDDSLLTE